MIAMACSSPPKGRRRWTIRLLADKVVELKIVDAVGARNAAQDVKKMSLSLG